MGGDEGPWQLPFTGRSLTTWKEQLCISHLRFSSFSTRVDGPVLRGETARFHLCQNTKVVHAAAGLRFQVLLLPHQVGR